MYKVGSSRIVLLIGKYAFKFPRPWDTKLFLYGMYCNVSERKYYKSVKKLPEFECQVVPSLFCGLAGLIQIQRRCDPLERILSNEEREYFKDVSGGDLKKENFGFYRKTLVCIDYA